MWPACQLGLEVFVQIHHNRGTIWDRTYRVGMCHATGGGRLGDSNGVLVSPRAQPKRSGTADAATLFGCCTFGASGLLWRLGTCADALCGPWKAYPVWVCAPSLRIWHYAFRNTMWVMVREQKE